MTGGPPRGLEERLRDTRAKLESDVDLWVATSGSADGVHLIPLSYLWDGTAFLISTPRASVTGRNLLAEGRVRLSLGPTRDVVVDGTAEPVDIADLGPETGERGAVEVDGFLRTSQPHIYALGDVNGGPQFTYISLDDSRIVLDQLIGEGKRSTADRVAIPHTLFMTPPLATVGLTEKEARAAGHRVKIASQPVAEIIAMPRAYIVEDPRGVMKFVLDADTDDILGAALLSIDAQELINTVALAMRHGVKAAELRDAVYQHPTSTEAFNDVLATIVRAD